MSLPSRAFWRAGFSLLAAVVVGAGLPVVTASAAHAAPAAPCLETASDAAAAQEIAARCGKDVELLGLRTETTRVLVRPDKHSAIEIYAQPQRARKADGTWAALDSTLQRNADGSYSPQVSTVDTRFSGGGTGPFASARRDGAEIKFSWPGALPEPVVSGSRATYANVLPGVDLVVTAQDAGFAEVLVVKDRKAAQNPKLRKIALGTALSGLRWETGDGVRAVDGQGRTVLTASGPHMWDSSGAPGASRVDGPGEGGRSAAIGLEATRDQLTLTPDASLLDNPDVTFPLYLDPTVTRTNWAMISSSFPGQQYFNYDKQSCSQIPNKDCAKVGSYDVNYRSMFNYPTSDYLGKDIVSATFSLDLIHSASCSNRRTEVRLVSDSGLSTSTTWNSNASKWGSTVYAYVDNQSCNDARKLTEFNVTSLITDAKNGNWDKTILGLRSDNEAINTSSTSPWKKFDVTTAKLLVVTNTVPAKPSSLTVDGKPCGTGANRAYVATATPTLRAYASDGDGDTMNVYFAWYKWNGSAWVGEPGGGSQSSVPNNTYGAYTATGNVDGAQYQFEAQINDQPSHTPYGVSPVSDRCEWQTDLTPPTVPAVTSSTYPENCSSCGSVGQTGKFTLASAADTASYQWGFSYPPTNTVTPVSLGASVQVSWTPDTGGAKTLYVRAIDRAGNRADKTYQFYVAAPSIATVRWRLAEGAGATQLSDDTGNGHPISTTAAVTFGGAGRIVGGNSAAVFNGSADGPRSGTAMVADPASSFSVAAWVKLSDKTTTQNIVSQAGTSATAFRLQYDQTVDKFRFVTTTGAGVVSVTTPKTDVWYHLVGTYDSAASQLRLFVNGVADGAAASGTSTSDPAGITVLGGSTVNRFKGSLSDATLWSRVIVASEIAELTDPTLNNSMIGSYDLSEVGPGPAYDSSNYAHDLNFFGGVQIPASGAGHTGTGMQLDGTDDYAETDGQAVRTNQSFSVTAWVWIDASTDLAARNYTAVSQDGAYVGGFQLGVSNGSGTPKWTFSMKQADSDSGNWDYARSATITTADKGKWVNLKGVFDAPKAELRLYVNGVLAGTAARTGSSWDAAGVLTIGRTKWTAVGGSPVMSDYWKGNLDEVRVYQGVLPDASGSTARWSLSEAAGNAVAADNGGGHFDGTVGTGVALGVPGRIPGGPTAARFNGTTASNVVTAQAPLDTTKSFSVSAWARITNTSAYGTVVAQDGVRNSAFYLQYCQGCGKWSFNSVGSDTDSPASVNRALSAAAPTVGAWTHLTGVYDAGLGQMRLYVNGVLESTVTQGPIWSANGGLTIGRGKFNGAAADLFAGDVADVRVWNRVINASEVSDLAAPSTVGSWSLDQGGAGQTSDSSGYNRPLTLSGDATVPAGYAGTGFHTNGAGYATTASQVIITDQSYTVSAWVRLTDASAWRTAIAQEGTTASGFMLQNNPVDKKWSLTIPGSDVAAPATVRASSAAAPNVNQWTQLTGVYDAVQKKASLYVNGVLAGSVAVPATFNATGKLTVGRDRWGGTNNDPWAGDIDEVKVFSGALTEAQIQSLTGIRVVSLQGVGSSRCLDIPFANPANGTQLQIFDCLGTVQINQRWSLMDDGTLRSMDKCLDIKGGAGAVQGALVTTYDCWGGVNQKWAYNPSTKLLTSMGLCLDVEGYGTANQSLLHAWGCTGTTNQQWNMI